MADIHVQTDRGHVRIKRDETGWWQVRREEQRAESRNLMRALRFAGLRDRSEVRRVGAAIRNRPST
jgi:hypothetical protein